MGEVNHVDGDWMSDKLVFGGDNMKVRARPGETKRTEEEKGKEGEEKKRMRKRKRKMKEETATGTLKWLTLQSQEIITKSMSLPSHSKTSEDDR